MSDDTHIEIRANASPESREWANRLGHMYAAWAEKHGGRVEGSVTNGEALVVVLSGVDTAELAENESGIHRLVAVSSHDPEKRRHTCFAAVRIDGAKEEHLGRQVRSIILHPYRMAKHYATDVAVDTPDLVLAGELEPMWRSAGDTERSEP